MPKAKLIVLYPRPKDVNEFERVYLSEHMPMVNADSFKGIEAASARKIVGTPDGGAPPYYRMAELTFGSMAALKEAASSPGAGKTVMHALSISTGGAPLFLIAEEDASATF